MRQRVGETLGDFETGLHGLGDGPCALDRDEGVADRAVGPVGQRVVGQDRFVEFLNVSSITRR